MPGLTPNELVIASLVKIVADPPGDEKHLILEEETFDKLSRVLLEEVRAARIYAPTLEDLLKKIDEQIPALAAEAIHRHLLSQVESIQTPDDIITRISSLKLLLTSQLDDKGNYQLIENGLIDPSSPLGHFIRRVVIESESLSFEGTCRLLRQVQAYFHSYQASRSRGLFRSSSQPEPPDQLQHFEQLQLEHNLWELDRFLVQGANAVAGSTVLGHSTSAPSPPTDAQARDAVQAALEVDISNPRAHLLSHYLALSDRDVTTALDAIRRYFDSTAAPQPLSDAHSANTKSKEFFALINAVSPSCRVASQGARAQHAMMALAVTQAHFGHSGEALQALHEAMRAAQQSNDDLLLTQALALLTQLMDRRRSPGEAEGRGPVVGGGAGGEEAGEARVDKMLVRCAQRAAELRLPHLLAFSALALARLSTVTGEGFTPRGPSEASSAHCVESALRSISTVRFVTDAAAASAPMVLPSAAQLESLGAPNAPEREVISWGSGAAGPILGPSVVVFQEAVPVAASTAECEAAMLTVRAGQLSLLATGSLALTPLRAQLLAHAANASAIDRAAAYALLVALEVEHRGPEAARIVLRRAQRELDAAPSPSASAEGPSSAPGVSPKGGARAPGIPAPSVGASGRADPAGVSPSVSLSDPSPHSKASGKPGCLPYLRYAEALVAQSEALGRRDADASDQACREMLAVTSHGLMPEEWRLDAELRLASHMRAFGRAAEAAERLSGIVVERLEAGDRVTALRALHETARCHLELESPSTALPYALSSVAHARDLQLDALHAEATVTLANALLQLGPEHAAYAHESLKAVRVAVLGQGSLALQARCQRVFAESLIAQCVEPTDLRPLAPRIVKLLQDAAKISLKIGDLAAARQMDLLKGLVNGVV